MIQYAKIYNFYRSALIRSIRLLVFVILFLLVINQFVHGTSPRIFLFLFNIFVIFEITFHFKISKARPSLPVSKNNGKDMYKSFTMQALLPFTTERNVTGIIKKLIEMPPS